MTRIKQILVTACLLLIAVALHAAPSVRLSLKSNTSEIREGDVFWIMISLHDINDFPDPVMNVPGCDVLMPLQPTRFDLYTVTVRARRAGKYSFGPISVAGVRSNKLSYSIKEDTPQSTAPQIPSGSGPVLQSSGNGELFLIASVSNSAPYEQQGVEYVVRLYTSYTSIFNWTAAASPKFGNCTYDASDSASRSLTMANYNGRTYESAVIARYIIYPTQPGVCKLIGNLYAGSVAESRTYSDPYHGTMRSVQTKQVQVKPNDLELNVKPLPEHDGDINGVGVFKVSAQLVSKRFRSHEPATVRYTISGTGNLGYVSLPDLREVFPAELKFLKSDDAVKKNVGISNVSGTVTFDCTFIPQREGEIKIPAVRFQFFNPESGSFYSVDAQEFSISVSEGSRASAQKDMLQFADVWQPLGALSKTHTLLISSMLFWLCFISPVLILLVILIIYRKRVAALSDITGMKMRRAGKIARKRLKGARNCMQRRDVQHFYEELLTALWGYIGDKLSMPTSELSRSNVSEELANAGVSEQIIDDAISLIDRCEYARYASASDSDMGSIYADATSLIDKMESEISSKN